MRGDVTVGVSGQSGLAIPLHACQGECPTVGRKRMYVDTDPDPRQVRKPLRERYDVEVAHVVTPPPAFVRSRSSASTTSRSKRVVTFSASAEPGTVATGTPSLSTRPASSDASMSPAASC